MFSSLFGKRRDTHTAAPAAPVLPQPSELAPSAPDAASAAPTSSPTQGAWGPPPAALPPLEAAAHTDAPRPASGDLSSDGMNVGLNVDALLAPPPSTSTNANA